jgi:hypothetical protein
MTVPILFLLFHRVSLPRYEYLRHEKAVRARDHRDRKEVDGNNDLSCLTRGFTVKLSMQNKWRTLMDILHRIPGGYIVEAMGTLLNCNTAKEKYVDTEVDIPGFGTVIFLFKRFRNKHGKSEYWFWAVQNAILKADLLQYGCD